MSARHVGTTGLALAGLLLAGPAPAADTSPLELVQTVVLKGKAGKLDHLALDGKRERLFLANTVNGTLVLPSGVDPADGCNGNVRIRYESGGKQIAEDFAGVRGTCKFKLSTVFENRRKIKNGKLTVRVRFLGNRFLLAKSPASKKARAG